MNVKTYNIQRIFKIGLVCMAPLWFMACADNGTDPDDAATIVGKWNLVQDTVKNGEPVTIEHNLEFRTGDFYEGDVRTTDTSGTSIEFSEENGTWKLDGNKLTQNREFCWINKVAINPCNPASVVSTVSANDKEMVLSTTQFIFTQSHTFTLTFDRVEE